MWLHDPNIIGDPNLDVPNLTGPTAMLVSSQTEKIYLVSSVSETNDPNGLTAQVYEEQTQEKAMRKMFSIECEYDGPEEKNLP